MPFLFLLVNGIVGHLFPTLQPFYLSMNILYPYPATLNDQLSPAGPKCGQPEGNISQNPISIYTSSY
jgi:hypothetical protein